MRVAFASVSAPGERSYWSGTPYFMERHLRQVFPDFVNIAPLQLLSQIFKEKHTLYTKALKENYLWELEPVLHRSLSAEVERRLRASGKVDIIISPGCFPYPNVFLDTEIPVVFWADATFAGLHQVHPGYRNLCTENVWGGEKLQKRMLAGAFLALFASHWAQGSAIHHYGVSPDRCSVVPFGANLHFTIESENQLEPVLKERSTDECRLLFVARQWQEKGGDLAVAVLNAVRAAGLKCKLIVLGCEQPSDLELPVGETIEFLPAIFKDGGDSEKKYAELLASTHFLLHPSRGDCFGIVMCEANAWAVPVLARDTGGAGTVVVDGKNGYRFAPEAGVEEYAGKIVELYRDRSAYLELCRSSWLQFKSRLNWSSATQHIARLLTEIG